MVLDGYELLQIPEAAVQVMVHLRWSKAREDIDDYTQGDKFLDDEFHTLHHESFEELGFACKLDSYTVDPMDEVFNSYLNDRELYSFLGLMYLSRLFESPENRAAFLSKMAGFREEQLMEIVEQGSIRSLVSQKPSASVIRKTNEILECEYVTLQPPRYIKENECLSPVLKRLRERIVSLEALDDNDKAIQVRKLITHFKELENEIVSLYKVALLGPRRSSKYENPPFTFTLEDSRCLLAAARCNGLFFDLISKRPPRCGYISHEQALLECAEHARLWLLNAKLPIYYNFKLRYCDLAKAETPSADELEAWKSHVGYEAVLLSTKEKRLRRSTLARYGLQGDGVYNLTPEDYVEVVNNPEVNIAMFLAFPVDKDEVECAVRENMRLADQLLERIKRVELVEKYEALEKMAKEWEESKMEASPQERWLITGEQIATQRSSSSRICCSNVAKKRSLRKRLGNDRKLQVCTTAKKQVPRGNWKLQACTTTKGTS